MMTASTSELYCNAFARIARPGRYDLQGFNGGQRSAADQALHRDAVGIPAASVVAMLLLAGLLPNADMMYPRYLACLLLALLAGIAIVVHRKVRRRPYIVMQGPPAAAGRTANAV